MRKNPMIEETKFHPLDRAERDMVDVKVGWWAGIAVAAIGYSGAQLENVPGGYAWLAYVWLMISAGGVMAVLHYFPRWIRGLIEVAIEGERFRNGDKD